eukprot:31402-Pelagococcus_subviridis.AAC.9
MTLCRRRESSPNARRDGERFAFYSQSAYRFRVAVEIIAWSGPTPAAWSRITSIRSSRIISHPFAHPPFTPTRPPPRRKSR